MTLLGLGARGEVWWVGVLALDVARRSCKGNESN